MDMKELLLKTPEELAQLLAEAERDEQEARRKVAIRASSKNSEISRLRRSVAKLYTAIATKKRATTPTV